MRRALLAGFAVMLCCCGCDNVPDRTRDRRSEGWIVQNGIADGCTYEELRSRVEANLGKTELLRTNFLGSGFVFMTRLPSSRDRSAEVLSFEEVETDYWVLRGIFIFRIYDEPRMEFVARNGGIDVIQDQFAVFSITPIKQMYQWQSQSRYVRGGNFHWSKTNEVVNPSPMYPRK